MSGPEMRLMWIIDELPQPFEQKLDIAFVKLKNLWLFWLIQRGYWKEATFVW